MEIYTTDLIEVAKKHAEKIEQALNTTAYVIEDECVNLQTEIRNIIYQRLSDEFSKIVTRAENGEEVDLKNDLFKIINNL